MSTAQITTDAPGAVVLLSGGLDSATVLAMVAARKIPVYALSFSYGQRQRVELDAAGRLADQFKVQRWHVAKIDLRAFGASALTSDAIAVPKDAAIDQTASIPVTYVPARNTLFLAHALAWAESLGVHEIHVGVNAVDYSGYPDCRPAFISAFEAMANAGTRAADGGPKFKIHAPLMHLKKHEIIARGTELGVDYAKTHSCYDPTDTLACGRCDACRLRHQGFVDAGIPDPTHYR